MSIRWKLLVVISLVLAINLGLGYFATFNYKRAIGESTLIREQTAQAVISALSTQVHFKKQVQEWKNILLRGHEPALYAKYLAQFEDEERETRANTLELIGYLGEGGKALDRARQFLDAHRTLSGDYRRALQLFERSDPLSSMRVDREVRGIDRRPSALIDEVVREVQAFKDQRLSDAEATQSLTEKELLLAVLGLLVLTLFVLFTLADRLIAQPISLATGVARRISEGNLSGEIPVGGTGESSQLLQALQTMQENLVDTQQALREERSLLKQRVEERTRELNFVNEELARAAKAKDLFLATMSHELRTPLTTVIGLTEMLRDQLYGPLNEGQAGAMRTIDESAHHLLSLINDILDVAKIESGKIELKLDFVPVEQLVESALSLVRPSAQRKQQQLHWRIDPRVKLVYADSRRLKQMLVNLLGNAVKFTPDQGEVGLEVQAVPEQGRVELTVWDTGIGIDPEKMERLFEPFVQFDTETGGRSAGTGLGLTLVNRMTSLHKGEIRVESERGKGSRFTLVLPWDVRRNEPASLDTDGAEGPARTTLPEIYRGARILLAEDNPANREMTRAYLEHQGLSVILAENGLEALSLARDDPPDLILMDVQLELMSGLEVTRKLKAMPGFSRLPIIALTAMAMPGDRESCLEAGMDDYISKPLGLKELLQQVIKLLKSSRRFVALEGR